MPATPPPAGSILSLRGVHKRLGQQQVLRGLDLHLYPGQCLLLGGANGAGKTTLLNIACALLPPDAGQVHWLGHGATPPLPRMRSWVGLLSLRNGVHPQLSAREALRLTAALHGLPQAQASEALEEFALARWAHLPGHAYSAGMLQRLALARLRLQNPRLLLLDEPYSALDAPSCQLLETLLKQALQQGAAILLATHHVPPALQSLKTGSLWLQQGVWGQAPHAF